MNRREFLKSIGLGVATASASGFTKAQTPKRLLVQKTQINGMAYYDAATVIAQLSFDDELILKREPLNPYDALAVEVYWGSAKLGYVPKMSNFALAKMLDQGERISAVIADINAAKLPYAGINIEITWESH